MNRNDDDCPISSLKSQFKESTFIEIISEQRVFYAQMQQNVNRKEHMLYINVKPIGNCVI